MLSSAADTKALTFCTILFLFLIHWPLMDDFYSMPLAHALLFDSGLLLFLHMLGFRNLLSSI